MKKVPEYARVSKDEYRRIRKEVETVSSIFSFDFREVWNLMIDTMVQRHAKVIAGSAKIEMTLQQAADGIRTQLAKERGRRDAIEVKSVS